MEPYAALSWHSLHLDGFTEKGGSAALHKDRESWNHATSTLGMRLSTSPKERVSFGVDLGWKHLHGKATPKSAFTFEGNRFIVPGAAVSKDTAQLGLNVGVKIGDNSTIRFQYNGQQGNRMKSHEGQIVFEMKW